MSGQDFRRRLRAGPTLLLDGPMGTELDRRGIGTELPLWSARALLSAPEVVGEIHRDYASAGAEVLTTNTFRTHRRSLAKAGRADRAKALTVLAVRLAREAANESHHRCWVAGSIAPLEDCYSPELTPPRAEMAIEHEEMARNLVNAGVDLLLVETMPSIREAAAATVAAVATGLPVLTGFTCDSETRLLSGESIASAAIAVESLAPDGLMINCTPAASLSGSLEHLAAATALPLGAYGNVGHAESTSGWAATEVITPADYVALARRWVAMGARLVGGCCGTNPDHTRALATALGGSRTYDNKHG